MARIKELAGNEVESCGVCFHCSRAEMDWETHTLYASDRCLKHNQRDNEKG